MYCTELRITEDREGERVRVLAPAPPQELPVSPQACADQHLLAELQGRWASSGEMPFRVEVRVWQDRPEGEPAARAAWNADTGFERLRVGQ
ncbi:hypothetical protein [Streptacidiphilus monticola]|uniref:Uncharacterized protein n=1 Tax=Streptacidiphilus monticola TaxID=2161674 RepID=A0ABW1G1N6_9ACTN